MRDSDYYPAGAANDPNAPYNEYENPDRDFDVTCSQTLSTTVTVTTNNYLYICDEDEDGKYVDYDTSDTNWAEEYHSNDYHTPMQLIHLFKEFLEQQKNNGIVFKSPSFTDALIEECDNWVEDETEYIQS